MPSITARVLTVFLVIVPHIQGVLRIELANVATTANMTTVANQTFVESADTVSQSMDADFDCRRTGHDCSLAGGVCDLDTGYCDCFDPFVGFTCEYQLYSVTNTCHNSTGCGDDPESMCVIASRGLIGADQAICYCSYNRYGIKCEKPRFELRCSEHFMTINVNPFTTDPSFVGHVYVINSTSNTRVDDPLCRFKNVSSHNDSNLFSLDVTYDNLAKKCGGFQHENESVNELKFIVQSDPDWLTTFDQIVLVRCVTKVVQQYEKTIIMDAPGATLFGRSIINPNDNKGAHLQVSNDLSNVPGNDLYVLRTKIDTVFTTPMPVISVGLPNSVDGVIEIRPINGSAKIGDIVVVTIENINDTYFTAIRAEDCLINMDSIMEAPLIRNKCPASNFAWTLLQWSKTIVTHSSVSFFLRLPATVMAGVPRYVTISCRVKLCASDAVDECSMDHDGCRNVTKNFLASSISVPSYGRRRRSVIEDDDSFMSTTYAYVHKTIHLTYDETAGDEKQRGTATGSASVSGLPRGVVVAPIGVKGFIFSLIVIASAAVGL